jgi:hypothetical protein
MADYTPERGPLPAGIDMAHGIIQAEHKGKVNTVAEAMLRRVQPHGVGNGDAYHGELLLPRSAPDLLRDFEVLLKLYEQQRLPEQRDLVGITTVRFAHDVQKHVAFDLARGFARHSFSRRNLVVDLVQHVPGLAGRDSKQHVHCLWLVRALHGCTFGPFSELTKPGARSILAAEWADWLAANA